MLTRAEYFSPEFITLDKTKLLFYKVAKMFKDELGIASAHIATLQVNPDAAPKFH